MRWLLREVRFLRLFFTEVFLHPCVRSTITRDGEDFWVSRGRIDFWYMAPDNHGDGA